MSTDLNFANFRQKKTSKMSTDLCFASFRQKIARCRQIYTLPNSGKKKQDVDRFILCQIQTKNSKMSTDLFFANFTPKNSKTSTDLYIAKFRQKIAICRQI